MRRVFASPSPALGLLAAFLLAGCAGPGIDRDELELGLRGGAPLPASPQRASAPKPHSEPRWRVAYGGYETNNNVWLS